MLPLVVQLALDDRRHQRGKWQLLTASSFEYEKLSGYSIAEVMGSNPTTRSITFRGIIWSSILTIVGQIQQ
jgi:hypothetical protein